MAGNDKHIVDAVEKEKTVAPEPVESDAPDKLEASGGVAAESSKRAPESPSSKSWLTTKNVAALFVAVSTTIHLWSSALQGPISLGGIAHALLYSVLAWIVVAAFIAWWPDRGPKNAGKRSLPQWLELSPGDFEKAVADHLRSEGYRQVEVVGGAGDLAADIIARDQRNRQVVVQCKRYAPGNPVGSQEIQTFIGMVVVHHKADRGIFVTTSTLTDPARSLATQHNIQVVEGKDLSG